MARPRADGKEPLRKKSRRRHNPKPKLLNPSPFSRLDDSAEWSDGEPSDDETEQEKKERTAAWQH